MIEPFTAGDMQESLDNLHTRCLAFRRDSLAATSSSLICPLFFPHVLVFLFSESHLSGFITLSGRNLVKLTLYKVISSDVSIKMPRDIYVLRQPSIAKVFACSVCDQKTGPICTAVLYLFGLKAAEKPVTSAVFTNQVLGYVMWFPLAPHDCVL